MVVEGGGWGHQVVAAEVAAVFEAVEAVGGGKGGGI